METPHAITVRREPGPFTRSLTSLILRVGLGMLFLYAGAGKLESKKEGKYPGEMFSKFEKVHLPFLGDRPLPGLKIFTAVLPYAETGVGALLIIGSFTTLVAFASVALLLALLFGNVITYNLATAQQIYIYLIINAGILWLSPVTSNYLSLDGFLFGWFWAPRARGICADRTTPRPTTAVGPTSIGTSANDVRNRRIVGNRAGTRSARRRNE